MTNVSKTPEKLELRAKLFRAAIDALEQQGCKIERVSGSGKSSVRRMVKGTVAKTVTIRTTQDRWIAFPRNENDDGWATLGDVDYVVASSVDDRESPRFAQVHMIDGDEMRGRFDRAYAARKEAGYVLPAGRGIWVSLYEKEANDPVTRVGAGAGLAYPPIARVPLTVVTGERSDADQEWAPQALAGAEDAPLTIAEAKRRLALSLGVNEADIKIIING